MKKHFSLFAMIATLIGAIVLLVLILNFTNPMSVGSFGVLFVFMNIYLITFLSTMIFVDFSRIIYFSIKSPQQNALSEEKRRILRRKTIAVVAIINFAPIFFISINSIGQLNLVSLVLLIAIETLAIFYALKRF